MLSLFLGLEAGETLEHVYKFLSANMAQSQNDATHQALSRQQLCGAAEVLQSFQDWWIGSSPSLKSLW